MRFKLQISYLGTNYSGWQLQPNGITVQEKINLALKTILKKDIESLGCGRTDAGVHAKQFFLHFDFDVDLKPNFIKSLNGILPEDISAISVENVKNDFNARFSATKRTYQYHIYFNKNPFFKNLATQWHCKLDIEKMNKACQLLIGKKNYQCFSKAHSDVSNYFCEIHEANWFQKDELLIFEISANRFLRNMVRAIVGTLTLIGENKLNENDLIKIIESKDRSSAGTSVPAQGLYLYKIDY